MKADIQDARANPLMIFVSIAGDFNFYPRYRGRSFLGDPLNTNAVSRSGADTRALEETLDMITEEEKYRILSTLHFAMPDDTSSFDESPPIDPQEAPAADAEADPFFDAACFLGCPACDEGGRMVDD